jgi:hypothetical protein
VLNLVLDSRFENIKPRALFTQHAPLPFSRDAHLVNNALGVTFSNLEWLITVSLCLVISAKMVPVPIKSEIIHHHWSIQCWLVKDLKHSDHNSGYPLLDVPFITGPSFNWYFRGRTIIKTQHLSITRFSGCQDLHNILN